MGTGIVANAAALLPVHIAGLPFAVGVWLLVATMLVLLTAATAVHWLRYPEHARRHHHDPAMAPSYGAPPVALLTVGAGALLLVGRDLIGLGAAVRVDEILWTPGTITGVLSTVAIPYLAFTVYKLTHEDTYATWLMPVVPPMVSAATGAALIAHLPAGQPRLALLLACYAMFGVSLFISLITITLLLGTTRVSRSRSCPSRSHAVDRARAARPVDHCRRPTRPRSPERHLGSVCWHPGTRPGCSTEFRCGGSR